MALTRRTRILLASGLTLLVVLIGAVLLAVHLLLQPQRFTALLESAASAAGLQLKLAQPASPELFPSPGLALQGLNLRVPGHSAPMLSAARGKLFVPWRALLGGVPAITRLQLDAPQINLDELDAYVASLPTGKAPWLPRIATGVRLSGGSLLSHGQIVLSAINVEAGQLRPGRPFLLTLTARNAEAQPLRMSISGIPRSNATVVALEPMRLRGSVPGYGSFDLAGSARWLGGSRAALAVAGSAGNPPLALVLRFDNVAGAAALDVQARRTGQRFAARFDPSALLAWWNGVLARGSHLPPLTPPPLAASASVAQMDLGPVHISGLSVTVDATPAPAQSAAPVAKTPTKR